MIDSIKKDDCCGCGACEQICPHHSISLRTDKEGFWYPSVEIGTCVNCRLCENVCPVINQNPAKEPIEVYAAYNKDEKVRGESSSGGIFTVIANQIIKKGGVVFGVKFNESWQAVFDYTETLEGLGNFRKSKYVQAWLGDTFSNVCKFLKNGRLVLFVGTPCQVAGLKSYLRKEYDNLLLMDLICEGVPSPKVWEKYLHEEINRQIKIHNKQGVSESQIKVNDISFRNKSNGWKQFQFLLNYSFMNNKGETECYSYVDRNSAYLQAMFQYLDLRPICYNCPFKCCKSYSDITIADYWGITVLHPEMDDDRGTSMIYINTEKGRNYLDKSNLVCLETSYKEAWKYNNIISSVKRHPYREKFYSRIDNSNIIWLLNHYKFTKYDIIKRSIKSIVRNILPTKWYEFLKICWRKIKD